MRRLFLFFWIALSLAAGSGPAFAVAAPDCPMATAPSGMENHGDMDCCKPTCAPACAAVCPGALMPTWLLATTPGIAGPAYVRPLAAQPAAARFAAADPPPRTTFS